MNAVISDVIRNQSTNSASGNKIESEMIKSAEEEAVGGQNVAAETSVSSKYDTVELSREYVEYKTQDQNLPLQDQTSQLNSTMVLHPVSAGSEEIVYNYQLYSYTELELLELMNNGTISRQDYEQEIANRTAAFAAGL